MNTRATQKIDNKQEAQVALVPTLLLFYSALHEIGILLL